MGSFPYYRIDHLLSDSDVIIDFTRPEGTMEFLKKASDQKVAYVIGTTGFNSSELDSIQQLSQHIPICMAPNMSVGINVLISLVEKAAELLPEYDFEVIEAHHKHKVDYPSGTALMLGNGIANGKNKKFKSLIGKKYLNKKNFPYGKKINFNSLRKGEVIGEHEVLFSSGKEIITLNHESFDRALYSEGALAAAKWLMNKKPGLYSMRNLLNFK